MTAKEQAELVLIEEGIHFNQEEGVVQFEYPIVGDINKLEDNWGQAMAIEKKVEERLERHGELDAYNDEMRGYLERGMFREISPEELKARNGPVKYIAHHGVRKPYSNTSKVRIISNSSLSNNNSGVSYNNMLPKGPNSLVPLIEALTSWRVYPRVVTWDYSKCYNIVVTTLKELHCR